MTSTNGQFLCSGNNNSDCNPGGLSVFGPCIPATCSNGVCVPGTPLQSCISNVAPYGQNYTYLFTIFLIIFIAIIGLIVYLVIKHKREKINTST